MEETKKSKAYKPHLASDRINTFQSSCVKGWQAEGPGFKVSWPIDSPG